MSKKLIIFQNPDKNEETIDYDDPGNLPHPFRLSLCSTPSCGKTNLILNMIITQKPEFEYIYILHLDEETEEYDFIDHIKLNDIPTKDDFKQNKDAKKLLVIEEMSFKDLSKIDKAKMDRLFGYVSSHYNLSIIISCQVYFNIPCGIRKMINYICVFSSSDKVLLKDIQSVIPFYDKQEYKDIIKKHLISKYDNLILCKNDKYMIKNLHELIVDI